MTRCAVVGAGAWGTALADLLARKGHDVALWAFEPEVADEITREHENRLYLAGASLDRRLRASVDMADVVRGAEVVIYAAPSHVLREIARTGRGHVAQDALLVVATKGIERETLAIMTEVVSGEVPGRGIVALSGPSFAAEVAARQPTAVVVASAEPWHAEFAQELFSCESFRAYTHDDVVGVELGGSLKNVMAVATGIVEGLGLGFNSRAALITRGLAEMTRLGAALGAHPATFAGLAGLGDLVLTCTGALSRNRALGMEIGRGQPLADALAGRHTVAEGVFTTHSAHALALREGIEMPIVHAAFRILFENRPPADAITELMTRELRAERD
jgi:glycerol-3-phosphate dehydrogenase (NAD(P)+)